MIPAGTPSPFPYAKFRPLTNPHPSTPVANVIVAVTALKARLVASISYTAAEFNSLNEWAPARPSMTDFDEEATPLFMLPMGITVVDLSALLGLRAVGAVTLKCSWGCSCLSLQPRTASWPHRRFTLFPPAQLDACTWRLGGRYTFIL